MLAAEIEHLLCFGNAANDRTRYRLTPHDH